MNVVAANKSKIIADSKFSNYDKCINPYVGCQIGCSFCYVRFFVKDKNHEWGDFVRVREHIKDKLKPELEKLTSPKRFVIGTMVDPYMPLEAKHKITNKTLEILKTNQTNVEKVGIFTRSPLVLNDADTIKSLPQGRVHYTISLFDEDVIKKIEPITFTKKVRLEAIKQLKDKGVRVHVNLAPVIPVLSDHLTEWIADELAKIEPSEIFIDPLQAYGPSYTALKNAMQNVPAWSAAEKIITNKEKFETWKIEYQARWEKAWKPYVNKKTLPLYCDHVKHSRIDLRNGNSLNWDKYDDMP